MGYEEQVTVNGRRLMGRIRVDVASIWAIAYRWARRVRCYRKGGPLLCPGRFYEIVIWGEELPSPM
jgi:hypothetical protein